MHWNQLGKTAVPADTRDAFVAFASSEVLHLAAQGNM
jgi:hypothetical protein